MSLCRASLGKRPQEVSSLVQAIFWPAVALALLLASRRAEQAITLDLIVELALSLALAIVGTLGLTRLSLLANPRPWSAKPITIAITANALGVVSQSWLLLSIGWASLAFASVERFLSARSHRIARPYWPCLLMVVPWVWADGWQLGLLMRSTCVSASEWIFSIASVDVLREGTTLYVNGIGLAVVPACAGLNSLQAFLVVGTVSSASLWQRLDRTLLAIPAAIAAAWIANTLRVIALGCVACFIGQDYVTPHVHDLIGWVILAAVAGALAFMPTSSRGEAAG